MDSRFVNEMCIFRCMTEMEGPNTASIHPCTTSSTSVYSGNKNPVNLCFHVRVHLRLVILTLSRSRNQKGPKRMKMNTRSAVLSVQSGDAIEAVRGRAG